MAASKQQIVDRGISGLPIDPHTIASISKNRRALTLRHVWPEEMDARAWDAIRRAYRRLARDLANDTGKSIEVYSKNGYQIDFVQPDL